MATKWEHPLIWSFAIFTNRSMVYCAKQRKWKTFRNRLYFCPSRRLPIEGIYSLSSLCTLTTEYATVGEIRSLHRSKSSKLRQKARHDLPVLRERAIQAVLQKPGCSRPAMTGAEVNDTSVIRGPAIMKAGRLDSYGLVQQAGVSPRQTNPNS